VLEILTTQGQHTVHIEGDRDIYKCMGNFMQTFIIHALAP